MTDRASKCNEPGTSGPKTRRLHYAVLGVICVLVIGVYAWNAKSGCWEVVGVHADNSYYNLLVQGFCAGQLSVKREVPAGLAQLADPYDPEANVSYLMHEGRPLYDLSYYKGKLHLYFGVTPALVLFWPYYGLTGDYLLHKHAAVIFCTVGFLASVVLLWAVWRRYFAEVGIGVVGACTLALGLASGTLLLLAPCDVYEVAISCGYALIMLSLLAIWKALHATRGRGWWLAGASLAYGLALGARPSLLFGAVILLVPVGLVWRERQQLWVPLLAATGPIMLIGLGLMLYNYLRFDNPFEFGQRYQLAGNRQAAAQQFSLSYLWINFRVAFLEPARWGGRFPFVHDIAVPPLPGGYNVEHPFGVLSNIPLVWLALAAPLAWRGRLADARLSVRGFLAAVAAFFGISALTLCLHNSMNVRYEVEFLPALVWLAIFGILGLERAVAGRRVWRRATRWGWGVLLAFSVAFNLFATFGLYADTYVALGVLNTGKGQPEEALVQFQKALKLQPDNADAHGNLGMALFTQGKAPEGIWHLQEALRLDPNMAEVHNKLGKALLQQGKVPEAIGHLEEALRLKPGQAEAQNNLGKALLQQGKVPEAIGHLEEALRLEPNSAQAHHNLGVFLLQQGKAAEAIGPLAQVVRLEPDFAEAHHNLGTVLLQVGKVAEAIGHLEEALRLKPDLAEAHNSLGNTLLQQGKVAEAIGHLEEALRLKPDLSNARNNLAEVLFQLGAALAANDKWEEAIRQYQRSIELKPDQAQAHDSLGLALSRQGRNAEAVVQYRKALELDPQLVSALNHLAWILATETNGAIRNVEEAVRWAERTCELTTNSVASYLDTLGVAYSEAGRFNEAMQAAERGAARARAARDKELAALIESRLKHYREGKPYHAIPQGTGP